MKVIGIWHGGSSYGPPDPTLDEEQFFSIEDAMNSMRNRSGDSYYPCIEDIPPDLGGHYMYLYRGLESTDYPDYILEFTMSGTLKKERVL